MILEKIKENKLILGLLLGVVIGGVSVLILIEREKIEIPVADVLVEEDPVVDVPVVAPYSWWLDEAFSRLEAEVTKINIAESYLMVKPLWPPMEEEIRVIISLETIIEKEVSVEKTIKDIENGHFVFFGSREDIREKTEITQFEWFTVGPPIDESLDIIEPELPDGEEQWWFEHPVFNLTGEVVEVNFGENYLRVRPVFPPLEQEIRVILEPGFTFEVFEMAIKRINDISVNEFIIFDAGEDIREKQVLEKVIRIQLFGDLLQ